jgi:hypothetical protein
MRDLQFSYFDPELSIERNPEHFHVNNPIYYRDRTIREYNEFGLKYVYHIYGDNPFCRIYSPDGTKIEIYNVRTVMKYIEYHKNEVTIARRQKDSYDYVEFYKNKFEPYKSKSKLLEEANIKEELRNYVKNVDKEELKKFEDDLKIKNKKRR